MKPGIPDGVHCIACALSPADTNVQGDFAQWEDIVSHTATSWACIRRSRRCASPVPGIRSRCDHHAAEDTAKAIAEPSARGALKASLATLRESINKSDDHRENLAFIAVVGDARTVDNGMITPTLKIKRAAVEGAYAARFEQWAAARKPVVWAF